MNNSTTFPNNKEPFSNRLTVLVKSCEPEPHSMDAAIKRTGQSKEYLLNANKISSAEAHKKILEVRQKLGRNISLRKLAAAAGSDIRTVKKALRHTLGGVRKLLRKLYAIARFLRAGVSGYFRALLARGTNREGGDTDARAPYGGGGEIGDVNAGGSFETSFLFSEPNSQQAVTNDSVTVEQSETAINKAGEAKRSPNHSEQRSMSDTNPKTVSWKPSYPGEKPPGNPFTKAAGSEKDEVKKETETGTGYFNREPRPSSTIKVRGQLPVTRVQKDPTAVAMPDEFRERFKKFSQSFGTSKKWTEPIDTSPADEEWFAKHTPKIQNVINGR